MSDLIISYHVSLRSPLAACPRVPLSINTINNNRFIFMCDYSTSWFPESSVEVMAETLEVRFVKPDKVVSTDSIEYYLSLFEYSLKSKNYALTDLGNKFHRLGVDMFVYTGVDGEEIPERLLIKPLSYVRFMKVIYITESGLCV